MEKFLEVNIKPYELRIQKLEENEKNKDSEIKNLKEAIEKLQGIVEDLVKN